MKRRIEEGKYIRLSGPWDSLGAGYAAAGSASRIAVGMSGGQKSAILGMISGMLSGGAKVISLGRCLETEVFFASRLAKCSLCVYVKDDPASRVQISECGGLPLEKEKVEAINRLLNRDDVSFKKGGRLTGSQGLREIYRRHI